jgi:hypothetical protein
MDILKAIYEFFGTPYPRLSLFLVTILGAAVFAGVWLFAAKQVAKDHQNGNAPSQMNGPASTTGNQSPAVTGNGNSFSYKQSSPKKK